MDADRGIAPGAKLYQLVLPEDLREHVEAMALERRCPPAEVLVDLAVQGARCARQKHDERVTKQ